MRVKVSITIEVENGPESHPSVLSWKTGSDHGDNPRFYGDSLRRAMEGAHDTVRDGLSLYLDLREQRVRATTSLPAAPEIADR